MLSALQWVLTGYALSFGVVLVAAMWLIGRLDAWGAVFEWIAGLGTGGLAGGMAVATVVLGAISFLTLRRAVP